MKYAMTAVGLVLAFSVVALPTAADAQRIKRDQEQDQQQDEQQTKSGGATVTLGGRKVTLSANFVKPYQELQAAVNANDAASIPAKLAAVQAVADSPEERYLVAQLQLKAAGNNEAAMAEAMEAILATGVAPAEDASTLYLNLGKIRYNAKQYDQAAAAFQKVLEANPTNAEATSLLAQTRSQQGRSGDAIADMQKALGQYKASGQKPPEDLYKRAVSLAYSSKSPAAVQLAREWVEAYPKPETWREALRIYRNVGDLDDPITLDVLRLARITGGLEGTGDFHRYGYLALGGANPVEAKTVVEEGVAAQKINGSDRLFRDILAEANKAAQGQRERLPELIKDALAQPQARLAIRTGDILYGHGDYAKAAELYRAALGKSGADKDLVNLRLGMALARAGDKAGATAAFNAVGGQRAELAKFWLVYLETQA